MAYRRLEDAVPPKSQRASLVADQRAKARMRKPSHLPSLVVIWLEQWLGDRWQSNNNR